MNIIYSPSAILSDDSEHIIKFGIGEIVYLITDKNQDERIVTAVSLRPNGAVLYCLAHGSSDSWHYPVEITKQRNVAKALSN